MTATEKSAFKVITCCSRVINFGPAVASLFRTLYERASERGKERTKTRSTRTGNENDESQIMGVNNATRARIVHATLAVVSRSQIAMEP